MMMLMIMFMMLLHLSPIDTDDKKQKRVCLLHHSLLTVYDKGTHLSIIGDATQCDFPVTTVRLYSPQNIYYETFIT